MLHLGSTLAMQASKHAWLHVRARSHARQGKGSRNAQPVRTRVHPGTQRDQQSRIEACTILHTVLVVGARTGTRARRRSNLQLAS
jgi:hypothetical protein